MGLMLGERRMMWEGGHWWGEGQDWGPGKCPQLRNLLYGDQLEYFLNSLQGVFSSPLSPAPGRCHSLCSDSHFPGRHSGKQREPLQAPSQCQRVGGFTYIISNPLRMYLLLIVLCFPHFINVPPKQRA